MARGRKKAQEEGPAELTVGPELGEKKRKKSIAGLFPDETVVMTAVPARGPTAHKYLATLGLYGLWRKRRTSTVTDRRVLMGRGLLNRTERSIPMRNIEDVIFKRQGLNGWVEVDINDRGDRKAEKIGPMSPKSARRFANEVLRRI
jgi:hypothetical protein